MTSRSRGDVELSGMHDNLNINVVPVLGDSPDDADELGDVLTLSIPDTVGKAGPKNGAIRESFRFRLRTSTIDGSTEASPGGKRIEEFSVAPAIRWLEDEEG